MELPMTGAAPAEKRPVVLFMASYGRRDDKFSRAQKEKGNQFAHELGHALVQRDIDLAIGGKFDMAVSFIEGAAVACRDRGVTLFDRLTSYYAENYPFHSAADLGKKYQIVDDEHFWTRVLANVDALVAFSGRQNIQFVIEAARILNKLVLPLGTVDGAARDAWRALDSEGLRFLGDEALEPRQMAERIADTILDKVKPPIPVYSKHLVLLVHGINTRALWMDKVLPLLESAGFAVAPISFGEFGIVRFISFPFLRKGALKRVTSGLDTAYHVYRNRTGGSHPDRVSIISHSFGTWLILTVLSSNPHLKFSRLIVCGSVIREDYDLGPVLHQFEDPLLNEIGTEDYWPAMAESVGWGYGSIGATGMHHAAVRNRWHKGFKHSDFLTADFCEKFWVPFLQKGEIKLGDDPEQLPPWIRTIARLRLRWLVLCIAIAAIATLLWGANLIGQHMGGINVIKALTSVVFRGPSNFDGGEILVRDGAVYTPTADDRKVWNLQEKVNDLRGSWETVPQYGDIKRAEVLERATKLSEDLMDVNDGSLGPSGHAIKREYFCYALIIEGSTETDHSRRGQSARRAVDQCKSASSDLESIRSTKDQSANLKYTAAWIRETDQIPFVDYLLAMATCLDGAAIGSQARKLEAMEMLKRVPSYYLDKYPPDRDNILKMCRDEK
jgi:hypothetical protein